MNDMTLEINGVPYTGFINARASKSMEDICGTFDFNVSALGDLQKLHTKNSCPCRILVNDHPFITGYIEEIEVSYDYSNHNISIRGRDKTCDIVDNTIGSSISFTAGVSLQDIIKKVLNNYGLSESISVSSNVNIDVFDKEELGSIISQIGESSFVFIERYAQKRQVLVMSDSGGNILLTRVPEKLSLKTILTSSPNYQSTILDASIRYNNAKRYYRYKLIGQKNPVKDALNKTDENVINSISDLNKPSKLKTKKITSIGIAYDEGIRNTREYNLLQESYNKDSDLQDRAQWESNYRMATGFVYTITVQGFSPINDPEVIWQPNMLVQVIDDYSDIPQQVLLIKSVAFSYSIDEGSTTKLELIDKDGYSVQVMQGVKYKKKRKTQTSGNKITDSVINDISPLQKIK